MISTKRFRLETCDLRILEADILERYESTSLIHTWECALCLSAYIMTIYEVPINSVVSVDFMLLDNSIKDNSRNWCRDWLAISCLCEAQRIESYCD
jgi:hypothetical protein